MTGPSFTAAVSEHPLASHAIGEAVGQVIETLGTEPDVAALFATGSHLGAIEDMAGVVRSTLAPTVLVGASAVSVLGGRSEVEDRPGVAVWAGRTRPAHPIRLTVTRRDDRLVLADLDTTALAAARTLVVLADPFSVPVEPLLAVLRAERPDLTVVGGLASAARGPGGNRLVLDEMVAADGVVGLALEGPVTTVVSQGCRPIGDPYIVTRAERNMVYELGGRPALERLVEIVGALTTDDRALAAAGLHIGRVIDERKDVFGRGDFLVRNVIGADRETGVVAVGDAIEVGSTVQFQVRDASTADEDLRALLAGRDGSGALVFTCNGRGERFFGTPDHDAAVVADALGTHAIAGMFCAGEIGPVGGQAFLHGFTASVALFPEPGPADTPPQVGFAGDEERPTPTGG